jgi:UDP-glucose 4-epimerase
VQDLRPVRDYCWVDDFAEAVVCAVRLNAQPALRTFNIGTMHGTSVAQVIERVLAALGAELPVVTSGKRRPGSSEIPRLVADNRHAAAILGWTPQTSLPEGLYHLVSSSL